MSDPTFTPTLIEELLHQGLGKTADELLRRVLDPQLLASAIAGAARTAEEMDILPLIGNHSPILQRMLTDHLPEILGINTTTRETLRNALLTTIADGGDLREQVSAVRNVFDVAEEFRAVRIARTENGIFWNGGGHEQAVAGGAIAHVWITSRDLRVRPSHAPMDNQCQPIEVSFVTGAGVHLLFPCDPDGPPEEIINCRCVASPLVRGCASRSLLFGSEGRRAQYWYMKIRQIEAEERRVQRAMRGVFAEEQRQVMAVIDHMFRSFH